MDPIEALTLADTHFLGCGGAISGRQWELPTPCTGWTVRQLVQHVTAGAARAASAADPGMPVPASCDGRPDTDWLDHARVALLAQQRALARLGDLGQLLRMTSGPMRAKAVVSIRTSESLIHGWDLAQALGEDVRLPPALVELVWRFHAKARERLAASRHFGGGPSGPERFDIPLQEQLLDMLGRRTVDPRQASAGRRSAS